MAETSGMTVPVDIESDDGTTSIRGSATLRVGPPFLRDGKQIAPLYLDEINVTVHIKKEAE